MSSSSGVHAHWILRQRCAQSATLAPRETLEHPWKCAGRQNRSPLLNKRPRLTVPGEIDHDRIGWAFDLLRQPRRRGIGILFRRVPFDGYLADRFLPHDCHLMQTGDNTVARIKASEFELAFRVQRAGRGPRLGMQEANVAERQRLAIEQHLPRDRHALGPAIAATYK